MPKSIPEGLTRAHVLLALADLDAGMQHSFGVPTGYELVHDGQHYPPKAVIGLAFKHLTGTVLEHEEFSGGNGPRQANGVLRSLGFEIVGKNLGLTARSRVGFVTSRNFALPSTMAGMLEQLWFNMWQRRLWPYHEVQEGDILYWYDSTAQSIVWKSRIRVIERFEYTSKIEVKHRFQADFGIAGIDDSYFDDAAEQGYCMAYKVDSLVRLSIAKPASYRFPQGGWLRSADNDASEWLSGLAEAEHAEGAVTQDLDRAASDVEHHGYFSPTSLQDERERNLREIVERRGQPDFRIRLIGAYNGRCAVTGCNAVAALEAAHIVPYCGIESNAVSNGLLLRADIHTLFDMNLIGINPESQVIELNPVLRSTSYADLAGQPVALPVSPTDRPHPDALLQRWQRFRLG